MEMGKHKQVQGAKTLPLDVVLCLSEEDHT